MERFKLGQRPGLDGLRGVATLIVVLSHFGFWRGGVVGLEILLSLSGFLITALLIEEWDRSGDVSMPAFYRRRFLRLGPPLVAMALLCSLVSIAIGFRSPYEMVLDSASALLFVSNGVTSLSAPRTIFGHTWSLAMEVQFYLLWPIAFVVMLRMGVRRGRILAVMAALTLAVMVARAGLFYGRPADQGARFNLMARLYFRVDTHSDTLLVGCLAGALFAWGVLPNTARFAHRFRIVGWLSLGFLAYGLRGVHHMLPAYYYGLCTVTGVAASVLMIWLVRDPPPVLRTLFENRLLVGVGRISYALYLFHMPICLWIQPKSPVVTALGLALSFAAAILSFFALERSVVRARQPTLATAPVAPIRRAA